MLGPISTQPKFLQVSTESELVRTDFYLVSTEIELVRTVFQRGGGIFAESLLDSLLTIRSLLMITLMIRNLMIRKLIID